MRFCFSSARSAAARGARGPAALRRRRSRSKREVDVAASLAPPASAGKPFGSGVYMSCRDCTDITQVYIYIYIYLYIYIYIYIYLYVYVILYIYYILYYFYYILYIYGPNLITLSHFTAQINIKCLHSYQPMAGNMVYICGATNIN